MAERKPLFMDQTEGFSEEMATSDSITLGGLTIESGGDIALSGGGEVTGLPTTPSGPTAATSKAYVDQLVVTGGPVRGAVLYNTQLDNTDGINAALAFTMQNNPTSGDTITLTDGTTTRTYGAGTGGDVQYTIGATVADTMANLAAAIEGDGSAIWGAAFTTNLDAIDADGVVVIIEDANTGTAPWIYGTWTTPADAQIVDFSAETDYTKKTLENMPGSDPAATNFGTRVIQASLQDGEIRYSLENDVLYSWDDSGNTWQTLSSAAGIPDATSASGGGVKGKVTFDSDFGLLVTAGVATINTLASGGLKFSTGQLAVEPNDFAGVGLEDDGSDNLQLSTQGNGIAGGGGTTLSVDSDTETGGNILGVSVTANGVGVDVSSLAGEGLVADGAAALDVNLETTNPTLQIVSDELGVKLSDGLTADANGTAVNLDATGSGLEFTGTAGDGTLGIKLEATNPTLQIDGSNQLGVLYDSNAGLEATASGLAVNVDGTSITFDGSGQLQASGSPEAQRVENTFTTATDTVAVGDPVYANGADTLGKALASSNATARVLGVIRSGSGAAPQSVEVVSHGPAAGVLTGATANTPYYLASAGGLTATLPTGGDRVVLVGYALNATDLFVDIRDYGKKAA